MSDEEEKREWNELGPLEGLDLEARQKEKIAKKIITFLEEKEFRYTYHQEKWAITCGFNTDMKIGVLQYIFDIHESYYMVYVVIDLHADKKSMQEVAEYLTRANYGIRFGNFELDMDDGEIRYKVSVDCDNTELSKEMIVTSFHAPYAMFERYGEHLCRVIFGVETAKDAIRQADAK